MSAGWDDAHVARAYERFCKRHRRYRIANEALASHAALEPGQRILDVAAGTGRTAEAVLPFIGEHGRVLCVEPAAAMRAAGQARLNDARISWTHSLPAPSAQHFDRIVCGAGIWQLLPLDATIATLAALLVHGGALVFNIPAQYLLEPDQPGGGRDPYLVELVGLLDRVPTVSPAVASPSPLERHAVLAAVGAAGLRPECWEFQLRFTQAAYRDWLEISPVSEGMLGGLSVRERARRLDEAYARADHHSWRWERWLGVTAWRGP